MIGFVVPFRPRSTVMDWRKQCELLNLTLESILNQTVPDFLVVLVYTDLPDFQISHPNLVLLKSELEFLSISDIEDRDLLIKKVRNEQYLVGNIDKGRKISLGVEFLRKKGVNYVMSVDSDDRISNLIAHFVLKNEISRPPGWFISKGYVYVEDEKMLYRQPNSMQNFNGSTHIVRTDLIPSPNLRSKKFTEFNFFVAHGWIVGRLKKERNVDLLPYPDFGVAYVINKGSLAYSFNSYSKYGIKGILKRIIRWKRITKDVKLEFNLK